MLAQIIVSKFAASFSLVMCLFAFDGNVRGGNLSLLILCTRRLMDNQKLFISVRLRTKILTLKNLIWNVENYRKLIMCKKKNLHFAVYANTGWMNDDDDEYCHRQWNVACFVGVFFYYLCPKNSRGCNSISTLFLLGMNLFHAKSQSTFIIRFDASAFRCESLFLMLNGFL